MITKETLIENYWTAKEANTILEILKDFTQEAPGRFRKGDKVATVLPVYKWVRIGTQTYAIKNEKAEIKKLLK